LLGLRVIARVARLCGPVVKGTFEAGLKSAFIFAEKSGGGGRSGQGGLKKPADELRLVRGSGFRENAVGMATRRRLGDFELCGGGEKSPLPPMISARTRVSARVSP
jgi:hypothetical protein